MTVMVVVLRVVAAKAEVAMEVVLRVVVAKVDVARMVTAAG